ncbi:MAG: hypothetical protein NTW67_04010, partial [Candidatus Woesearchaeota archaeon]|nr:hypothetical protein [Candidatus Woesearchaeota archaeon]
MVDKPFLLFGKPHDEAHKDEPLSKRELCVLKTLRAEVVNRVKFIEKKEAKLRELEKTVAGRERAVLSAESRVSRLQNDEKVLRGNISSLNNAFKEQQKVLDERKYSVAQLSKELAVLLEKRSEIRRVEVGLAEAIGKEKNLRNDISKKEQRVAEGARIISKQEEDIEKHMSILKNLRDQLEQAAPLKRQLDSELEIRQQNLLKAKRDLAGLESAVKKTKRVEVGLAEAIGKEKNLRNEISKKEQRVAEGARIISKQEEDIEKH